MRPTERYWEEAGVSALLLALAWLLGRPILGLGSAGIAAVLLARELSFLEKVGEVLSDLDVEQKIGSRRVSTGEEAELSLKAVAPETDLEMAIYPDPPLALDLDIEAFPLELGQEGELEASFPFTSPVPGIMGFGPAKLEVSCEHLSDQLPVGERAELVVESRAFPDTWVGTGGRRLGSPFGEHKTDRKGFGFTPEEVRRYMPGDARGRIDWKATARLDEPYVREHRLEIDRETVIILDASADMSKGPEGGTKLRHATHVALGIARASEEMGDPLGLYVVDQGGIREEVAPDTDPETYASVKDKLLQVTELAEGPWKLLETSSPAEARKKQMVLTGTDKFSRALAPLFEKTDAYVEALEQKPLFHTVRRHLLPLKGSVWAVLITDDSDRTQVLESARVVVKGGNVATLFITPDSLYSGGILDLEEAHRRYVEFEKFRRRLAGTYGIEAFEVGPRDRITEILDMKGRVEA